MASFFFNDYHFPSELYNRETNDFTAPIRTLLDFTPHILQELPKEEKDQKPIHSKAQDSWTKNLLSNANSFLSSETVKSVSEFVIRRGSEYIRSNAEKKQERLKAEEKERRRRERKSRRFYNKQEVSSSEEEEEKLKQEKDQQNNQQNDQQVTRSTNNAIATSAVAASVLSFSLYSTYQASINFSDISFHNQLELIITQVKSIIQSTQVWIEEHEKMDDKVPNQVRVDVTFLKELIENLVKLDPRANKKIEATGWGVGAVGGLSILSGIVLGSTIALTGGAVVALGGVVAMVTAKAHSVGKSQLGTRLLLENQVREKVKAFEKNSKQRLELIQNGFDIPKNKKIGDKRKILEVPSNASTKRKEKIAVLSN